MSDTHRYSGVVFDLDGTLVDSSRDITAALNRAFAHIGAKTLEPEQVTELLGHGARRLVADALARAEAPQVDLDYMTRTYLAEYRDDPVRNTRLYPGVAESLRCLRDHGVPLGVCTNKDTEMARRIVDTLGIGEILDIVAGPDTVERPKPDAQHLRYVLDGLSVDASKALMIGDSMIDAAAAVAAAVDFRAVGWAPQEVSGARLEDYEHLPELVLTGRE